jgi:hypothetical protein
MSDENPTPNQYPLGEPSVLDYVKSLLRFGDGERIHVPVLEEEPVGGQLSAVSGRRACFRSLIEQRLATNLKPSNLQTFQPNFPWRSLLALFLA